MEPRFNFHQHLLGIQVAGRIDAEFESTPAWQDLAPEHQRPVTIQVRSEPFAALWDRLPADGAVEAKALAQDYGTNSHTPKQVLCLAVQAPPFHAAGWAALRWTAIACQFYFPGAVVPGGYAVAGHTNESDAAIGFTYKRPDRELCPRSTDFVVSNEDFLRLPSFLRQFHTVSPSITGSSDLRIAWQSINRLHVFNMALSDRFFFLSVALEAILSPSSRDELTERVAQRAAKLIAQDATAAERVYRACRAAYGIRSQVAHGSFTTFSSKEARRTVGSYWKARGIDPPASAEYELLQDVWAIVRLVLLHVAWNRAHGLSRQHLDRHLDHPWARLDADAPWQALPDDLAPICPKLAIS